MERHHHHPALSNTSADAPSNRYRSQQEQSNHEHGARLHSENANREDIENLEETVTHQKMEIVRLLNTVKTLSTENTKLVKVNKLDSNNIGSNVLTASFHSRRNVRRSRTSKQKTKRFARRWIASRRPIAKRY